MLRIWKWFIPVIYIFTLPTCDTNTHQFQSARFTKGARTEMVTGRLFRPEGTGPFPALVMLHSCGGVQDHHLDWARRIRDDGYVTFVVDTFGSRGENVCPVRIGRTAMIRDAYGALDHLARLPFVKADRIGVMGFSAGGNAIDQFLPQHYKSPQGRQFKAAVNMYGRCENMNSGFFVNTIPTAVIIGNRERPDRLLERRELVGKFPSVSVYILEDAYHAFDNSRYSSIRYDHRGNPMLYNAVATERANRIVRKFLNRILQN